MIKICSPQLGISPKSNLGGEIYDYQTIKGFCKKGFKVFVYLPKNRPYDKTLLNLKVTYCFMKHIFPPWIYSFLCLPYLFKTYKKEKFDILRIQSPRFLGIAVIVFNLIYPKVPILSSGVTIDSPRIYYLLERYVYNLSKAVIVQSQYMKKFLTKKYLVDPRKIYVTYGGKIDSSKKWHKLPEQAKLIKENDKIILFMSLLIERKNPIFAVKVFLNLRKRFNNLKFIIIGSGPLKNELQFLVSKESRDDDVIFIDSAYGEEKAYWFERMDLFILPSLDEGFGLVVTEVMSFGKPVITSNKAAFPEIIDNGKEGYTLPLSINTWVKLIDKLLRTKSRLLMLGKNAKKRVDKEFNWQKTYNLNKAVVLNMLK